MRRICVLPLLALTACNPLVRQSDVDEVRSENLKRDIRLNTAIDRIDRLERIVEAQGKYIDVVSDGATAALNTGLSVSKQVEENAKVANENAVKDMNRRGACGYRPRYTYNEAGQISSIVNEKILCTVADLAK